MGNKSSKKPTEQVTIVKQRFEMKCYTIAS